MSTRLEEVEIETQSRRESSRFISASERNDLARTLAAEVDDLRGKLDDVRQGIGCARGQRTTQYCADLTQLDEVITKLLDLLLPGVAPPHDPCGCVECKRHEINEGRYRRALEIAGRTE